MINKDEPVKGGHHTDIGVVPDYDLQTISREEIVKDLGSRLEQADRIVELGNTLKQNVFRAGRKCGISKEEIHRARFMNTVEELGPELMDKIDPLDIDRIKK